MKISDLITNDKESIILAINLLGKESLNFFDEHNYDAAYALVRLIQNFPERLYITDNRMHIKGSWVNISFDWFKTLIDEYEISRNN